MTQRLRVCLPRPGTRAQSLGRADFMGRAATGPVYHCYRGHTAEPALPNKRSTAARRPCGQEDPAWPKTVKKRS